MKKSILAITVVSLLSCSPQDMQNVLNSIPSSAPLSNDEDRGQAAAQNR